MARRLPRISAWGTAVVVVGVLAWGFFGQALASDEPDELAPGRLLIVKTGRLAKVILKPAATFDLPDATNDPRTEGATLQIADSMGASNTYTLPSPGWRGLGSPGGSQGYRYKGAGTGSDPCRSVVVKDTVVKAVCKGVAVTLATPFTGNATVVLTVGTDSKRYCAEFGGVPVRNDASILKRKTAPAPAACPGPPPSTTSTTIGGGTTTSTTIPAPSALCPADPSRVIFAGSANSSACHQVDDDQASCEQADHVGGDGCGASSCFFDFSSGECRGCGINNQQEGACINTCVNGPTPTCPGDSTRTIFAGYSGSQACQALSINPTLCNKAFHVSGSGFVASCYFDEDFEECRGCGPQNLDDGACQNTCAVCPGDPTRTVFAGYPGDGGCHKFDASPSSCEGAFIDGGNLRPTSCYYDSDLSECRGCGPQNQSDGACTNECATCDHDPSRTIFLGGPGTSACTLFDGNAFLCNQAYHLGGQCSEYSSCFYDVDSGGCLGCGPSNEAAGLCSNTCSAPGCGDNDVNHPLEQCDGPDDGACMSNEFCAFNCTCQGCSNDGPIPAGGGTVNGTTSGTGSLQGGCTQSRGPERVYQWTPNTSGQATIKLCANFFYGVLYVRNGGCTGTEIGCHAFEFPTQAGCSTSARVTPTVTAGTPYSIVVDGYFDSSAGNFALTVIAASPSGAFLDDPGAAY